MTTLQSLRTERLQDSSH